MTSVRLQRMDILGNLYVARVRFRVHFFAQSENGDLRLLPVDSGLLCKITNVSFFFLCVMDFYKYVLILFSNHDLCIWFLQGF